MRNFLCLFLVLLLSKVILLTPLFGQDDSFDAQNQVDDALAYEDAQELDGLEGCIVLTYDASGANQFQDLKGSAKMKATITIISKKTGCTITVQGSGSGSWKNEETKTKAQSSWQIVSSENANSQDPAFGRCVMSKKLGLVHFDLGFEGNSPSPHPPYSSAETKATVIATNEEGQCMTETFSDKFMAHIPLFSQASTKFASLIPLVMSGTAAFSAGNTFELLYQNGQANGSTTFQMMVMIAPTGASIWDSIERHQVKEQMGAVPEPGVYIQGTLKVEWALGSQPPRGKMKLEPADTNEYDKWLPAPLKGNYSAARPIAIKAKIEPEKADQKPPTGRIDFYLYDISKHKGECTNYPVTDEGTRDDLRFFADQEEFVIDPNNANHAWTKKENISEATILVEARDTGAWGKIKASCDKHSLKAEYQGQQFMRLPKDNNANHIADTWEQEKGVKDFPADYDEDQPSGQRRLGDGYTLYEEYRGFMTMRGFKRTNPKKKDLFIYDRDGLVQQWYENANPGKFDLHYVNPTMIKFTGESGNPDNRWVNTNSNQNDRRFFYARQYAMYVVSYSHVMAGGTVGEVNWHVVTDAANGFGAWDGFKEPLKRIYIIKMFPNVVAAAVKTAPSHLQQSLYRVLMESAVIHEMGHGMGIHHHSFSNDEEEKTVELGYAGCSMRYTSPTEYAHPGIIKPANIYCLPGHTWQMTITEKDDDGNIISSRWEMKPSFNCFKQIDIKSDP